MPARARRPGRHHPRPLLPRPSASDDRARSGATTPRSRADHARRADARRRHLRRTRRGRSSTRLGVAAGAHHRLPAGRAGLAAPDEPSAGDGPILFVGTLEPRKNVPGPAPRVCGARRAPCRTPRRWCWRAAPRRRRIAGSIRHDAAARRTQCARSATCSDARAAAALSRGVDARPAVARRRVRHAGARGDDGRRAGGRLPTAARCRKWSATPACSSTRRTAALAAAMAARRSTDADAGRRMADAGLRRAARVHVGDERRHAAATPTAHAVAGAGRRGGRDATAADRRRRARAARRRRPASAATSASC